MNMSLHKRAEYIWDRLEILGEDQCWEYPSARGRAYLTVEGIPLLVYRIVYEDRKGPIPEGMNVLHTCDNGRCCRPSHLVLGDQRENALQAVERGLIPSKGPIPRIAWQRKRGRWQVSVRYGGQRALLYVGNDLFEAACRLFSWRRKWDPLARTETLLVQDDLEAIA